MAGLERGGQVTLSIQPLGQYAIDSRSKRAILNNRGAFLAGTVGPDFYPDLIVGQAVVHPGVENGWKTKAFIQKLLNSAKTDKEYAFALGYMVHAASDVFAHSYVNMYSGDEFDLFDGELDVELRHIVLEGYLSQVVLNPKQLARLRNEYKHSSIPTSFIKNIFFDDKQVLKQYKSSSTNHIKLINTHKKSVRAIRIEWDKHSSLMRKSLNLINDAIGLADKYKQVTAGVVRVEAMKFPKKIQVPVNCKNICPDPSDWDPSGWFSSLSGSSSSSSSSSSMSLNPCGWACDEVDKWIEEATSESIAIAEKLNSLLADKRKRKEAIEKFDLISNYLRDIENGIDDASVALVDTSHKSAKHVILGNESLVLDEYKEWVACHGPILGGVPTDIAENVNCRAYKLAKEIDKELERLEDLAGPWLYGIVGYQLKQLVEKEVRDTLKREGIKIANSVLGVEIDDLYALIKHPVNSHSLNRVFESNGSHKGLLNIDNMSQKVALEISGNQANKLYNFNPTYNAIQLSKVSLLAANVRGRLASDAGFNAQLNSVNPVLQVDNIDADHQWLKTPLPLPREHESKLDFSAENRFPGMNLYTSNRSLFKLLFKGPLNIGLHSHSSGKALPNWYEYNACSANPFPMEYGDGLCAAVSIIPVITFMLF